MGQRSRTAKDFTLDDICGAGGRWDLMARCVQASLFVSHDLRRDTELALVLCGPPDPPKSLRIVGRDVRYLNPDERSTVALLSKALELRLPDDGWEVRSTPGVLVSRRDLGSVLDTVMDGPLVLLDEGGRKGGFDDVAGSGLLDATYVIGDDKGLSEEQLADVRSRAVLELSLGPVSLHADHCISVVHNHLDRCAEGL